MVQKTNSDMIRKRENFKKCKEKNCEKHEKKIKEMRIEIDDIMKLFYTKKLTYDETMKRVAEKRRQHSESKEYMDIFQCQLNKCYKEVKDFKLGIINKNIEKFKNTNFKKDKERLQTLMEYKKKFSKRITPEELRNIEFSFL